MRKRKRVKKLKRGRQAETEKERVRHKERERERELIIQNTGNQIVKYNCQLTVKRTRNPLSWYDVAIIFLLKLVKIKQNLKCRSKIIIK